MSDSKSKFKSKSLQTGSSSEPSLKTSPPQKKDTSAPSFSNQENRTLKELKSSVSSRGFSLAKLGVQAGLGFLSHKMKKASQSEDSWKAFLTQQSQLLGRELGELKGSLMKAGQMLSVYGEYFLPPEANVFLKKLQADSPPVDWTVMQKNLKQLLSSEVLQELDIQTESLACASMGQVHRARVKETGEELAIKIQYPNVDKAISSDLKALKSILSLMNLLPKDFNSDSLFQEVRSMLEQEVRYDLEAELTLEYAHHLKDDPRYLVPRVNTRYSNQRVLSTSYMPGVRVDDPLVKNLSQNRRNALAESFLDLYFRELFDWRLVQTDPHFGNYKIKLDPQGHDSLVLLDFGATRRFTPEFMTDYKELIRSVYRDEKSKFYEASYKLGFLHKSDPPELQQAYEDFCFLTLEPFKSKGPYNWKNNDLPSRASQKAVQIIRNFSWRTPPQEILFLDRKTGGVFIFLSALEANIDARPIIEKYL